VQELRAAPVAHLRDLSAVLLRKLLMVDDESLFEAMSPPARVLLCDNLLAGVETETERSVRRAISDTVADLAIGIITPEAPWPQLYVLAAAALPPSPSVPHTTVARPPYDRLASVCMCCRYMKLDAWVKGPVYELRESALYIFEFMSHFFVHVRCCNPGASRAPLGAAPMCTSEIQGGVCVF
jgi:hypothetical protein